MLGALLGEILSPVITGVLCNSQLVGGWPAAFYLFGNRSASVLSHIDVK